MNQFDKVEAWFVAYGDDIYSFLIYYTGQMDVEDLVQDVFLKALKSIEQFENRSKPKTWLLTIARNIAIDRSRRNKLLKFIPFERLSHTSVDRKDLAENLVLDETLMELYEAIHKLKKPYQDILILRLILELPVDEAASILNWSNSKVSLTFHRALKAVQKELTLSQVGGQSYESD